MEFMSGRYMDELGLVRFIRYISDPTRSIWDANYE